MAQPRLTPVDFDPFAQTPAGQPATGSANQPKLTPVDFDPFAAGEPASAAPSGFATRAQREGSESGLRQAGYLADAIRTRQQQDRGGIMGDVDAAVRGAAGWIPGMDKLAAAGDAAFGQGAGESFGERYSDNLERQRAVDDADRLINSNARLAGQAAGLVGTAMVLPGVAIVREGARGAATANAAATGALYGAVTGAIESDGGVADKASAGLQTGLIGGAFGAVAPTFVRGAEAFARATGKLGSSIAAPFRSIANPDAEAARRVGAAFARDGVTDPAAALSRMQAQGAPAVIGDVGGETTRALARSAANLSPEGRGALLEATADRFAGQGDRITDLLRSFGPSAAGKTMEQLEQVARLSNRPAYARAYMEGGNGLWSENIASLAQAPAVQDAIRGVIKTGANKTVADGMPPVRNPFTTDAAGNLTLSRRTDGSIATPNLQFWDYVARELRGKAGEAARAGNKDLAGDFNNLRRMLLNELDAAVPSFRQARSGAAQFFQAEDALEAGQKFASSRMANDEARKAVAKMRGPERKLFAEGYRSDLIAKIREAGDGRDIVKAVFGSPAARERVEIALGSQQAKALEAVLTTETAMLRLQNALGNSKTAQFLAEYGMSSAAGSAAGYYQGGSPGAVAGAVAGAALRRGTLKLDQGLAKKIGEMLASGDVRQLQRVTKLAAKSPAVMKLLDGISDEAGKIAGLSSSRPFEVTVRPGGMPMNLPAAADEKQ
ncbi:MAG TPA: hypothetical protein VGO06_28445 [Bosea sp. (in: a-proteobacteria)]|jgi:hypothetical protein|uniref:hypothetical protein n=1 Tax=Bosea sp. (in: a-proteobacteria) TaxID=1871050 RepID=UPI002E0D4565|nr:hypothetical protein [Bosea sp. (in: a-proteobacteria)]